MTSQKPLEMTNSPGCHGDACKACGWSNRLTGGSESNRWAILKYHHFFFLLETYTGGLAAVFLCHHEFGFLDQKDKSETL